MAGDKKRDSFIFYRSYFESINQLPEANQLPIYKAVAEYALNNIINTLQGVENSLFTLIKPTIDSNNKRYINGCKGGRPSKEKTKLEPNNNQNITETKPKHNQTETKPKPNDNVNDNNNYNYKENISVFNTNTKEKNLL